jgi:Ca2+/Na+ antiporter
MKKSTPELVQLILTITVSVILIMAFAGIVFSQRPTTPENEKIREQLLGIVETIVGGLVVAIGIGKAIGKKED